ncbi:unnamed protein product [Polarella glacialis]|uniref:Uncharacterized protein n=1 Tax=Polarella glacialis TaxID=89957 RepID=A0A813LSL4_POLGL|nr:unnamed protein product [Polarella glacialis]
MSDVVSDAGSRGSTSRKRKTADAAVDSGITALIGASEEADIAFIVKGLRESPEIIPVMAGRVRDGVLQKSLAHRASQKQAPQDIGKKMSIGLKTWGKLGIRFLQKFLKQLPSVDLALADDDNTMSFVDLQGLIFYALSVQASTKLPIQHAMAGYEGPLISVMNVQYETMGNRLAGLTRDNVSEYVYFKWSVERPTEVIYHLQNLTMQLPFDSGFMLGVHDWALVKNTTHEAQLVSESSSIYIKLFEKKDAAFPDEVLPNDKEAFEHPAAFVAPAVPGTSSAALPVAPSAAAASVPLKAARVTAVISPPGARPADAAPLIPAARPDATVR